MIGDDNCPSSGGGYPSDCEITQGLLERARARQQDDERGYVWRSCLPKVEPLKLLLLDVDGVLTDATITYTHSGTELKSFNTKDGFGIRLLREAGVEVGLITARTSEAVTRRAQDLKLTHVYQGARKKVEIYQQLVTELSLEREQVGYMGDDWLDLPLLTRVGFAATVADAVAEVRNIAHYVTKRSGGRGAVREVCDLIIAAKGMHQSLLEKYIR